MNRALILLAAFAVALALVGVANAKRLTIYSVAQREQYVDNSDSRILGVGNNPFGNFKDVTPVTSKGNGPYPGDEAVFTFNLYSDAALGQRIGTAQFTCQYNFKKNAFCDAEFDLQDQGLVLATGGFNFNASKFTLVVTGGTRSFLGKVGTLAESPAAKHAQKLVFTLA